MQAYLANLIDQVYTDFRQQLTGQECFCDLLTLNFGTDSAPNYQSPLVQQLYLLRYYPAYLVEYYLAWRDLFELNFLPTHLQVLSIGCGNAPDYTALRLAARDTGNEYLYYYDGADRVQWHYRDPANRPARRYHFSDIVFWTGFRRAEYNVVTFPKSIGEFSDEAFSSMLAALGRSHFTEDRLCLMSSVRASRAQHDKEMLERVLEVFEQSHGYKRLNPSHNSTQLPNQPVSQVSGFYYPEDVYRFLESLNEQCPAYDCCTCHDCGLSRRPMLNTKGMEYQIIRMER